MLKSFIITSSTQKKICKSKYENAKTDVIPRNIFLTLFGSCSCQKPCHATMR